MPHKRKNAKAARSAPEGFSLAFLQQCGMGNKARSEEISFGGRKKILKFLSDLIGATPIPMLSSMNMTKNSYSFVPLQDFSKPWTDAELYEKYNLSQEEIAYIESMIKPMDSSADAESEPKNA